ncbi:glycosyltransferase family 1 protein [Cucurbitaria berberidis CBS 394.84]|uniref:Glycosyltransferase family 1 protein n=1 Tax=Cucurbitaria berberidis CBS 394.84 TaxID=1168544 RepID=A0A9P4LEW4_9PLEO|nr:glycosyltransferase family 1 protein [Cucurbitaria berberidis CBS 394.84]KAF1851449.1 glycosyltransferase family 1 protein [Cucurbitaria berberidis CBS 394.84]
MSSSNNAAQGNDAPRRDAPPSQPPPGYTEQNAAGRPSDAAGGASQSNATSQSGTKPEGSAYAGAYRPSEAPAHTATPSNSHHAFDPNQVHEHEPAAHDLPPPAYTELPGQISSENNDLGTNAVVAEDGRVNIRIDSKSRALSQLILPQIQRQLSQSLHEPAPPPPYVPEFLGGAPGQEPPPPLNVVIQVVGSRGDVQPFVALGKVLKDTYGHRVRLATHPTFKDFVIENGLEFFSIGGDPAELMAFMVKNPGLMPGFDTLRSGDIGKRRKGIAEILQGTWRSCIETGNGLGVDPLQQTVEEWMGIEDQLPEQLRKPFVADAIIANPPSFGHIHCAEKLGIPLHIMFTMPWSPTQQFPHPLANIQSSNADATITNYMSYLMVDVLTWQGLGDVINRFRKDSLRLDPISAIWAPAMLARLKIPFTYCWSPALIPKPRDWTHHISVAGFYFLNLASNYTPDPDLAAFLDAGEPPVYIGFGSIVVDDPNAMTAMIFDAVKRTNKRALVSKGWGGLGADELGKPEGVFMLGNCPHDWLFKRVSAVVHHGGAGTTAAGIAAGKPTVVIPFFGDQAFWGAMVSRAGAGPDPIPYKDLTAEKLAGAINEALKPESLDKAQELCNKIKQEDGCQKGAQSFHQMLHYDEMRCAVIPSKPAVWRIKRTQTKLSAKAATVLAQQGQVNFSELKLFRAREFVPDEGPWDPVSGAAGALMGTATSMMMGVADMPIQTLKLLQIHPDARSRKGKEKVTSTETLSTGESSGTSRPRTARTTTSTTEPSAVSGTSTPTATQTQSNSNDLSHTQSNNTGMTSPGTPGTPTHRSTFMSQAFAESTEGSRSSSRERARQLSPEASESADSHRRRASSVSAAESKAKNPQPGLAESVESAMDTGRGLARIIGAASRSPMDFSLNVAKGFHNVPKLYGAEVRQVDKVTDLQSGLRTAAKEFGFGLYDGITGIVTDPYKGAKKEGGIGFVKGVGRGIMSVPFRVMGGAWSVPGYAMKGLYQEMIKSKGKSVQNYIIAARIAQGYDEASSITTQESDDILSRWKYVKVGIKKKRNPGAEKMDSLQSLVEDKKKRKLERWERVNSHLKPEADPSFSPNTSQHRSSSDLHLEHSVSHDSAATEPEIRSTIPSWRQKEAARVASLRPQQHAATFPRPDTARSQQSQIALEAQLIAEEEAEQRELERAITASVAESSRGNPEDDRLIASAIRASIAELERAPPDAGAEDEEELLKRAMQASMEEAGKTNRTEEEQKALEETLRKSILETGRRRMHGSDTEWDEDSDTEEDEEFQRIIAESKELAHLHANHPEEYQTHSGAQESGVMEAMSQAIGANSQPQPRGQQSAQSKNNDDDDAELKKVLEESEQAEKERMEKLEKQKTEEDIVMEYVRKQSLLEEEHRQRVLQGRDTVGENSGSSK